MNNTEFKKIVGETLKPQGFAYENKYYTFENTDLKVFIGFQKSNFENSFYINYCFFIKKLHKKLERLSHGFGDFGGRFVYNDNDKMLGDYKLSDLTEETLSESILENAEKFIKPAFEKGIDGIYKNQTPPPSYVFNETKWGSSQINQHTKSGPQMSQNWVRERLGNLDPMEQISLEMALETGECRFCH